MRTELNRYFLVLLVLLMHLSSEAQGQDYTIRETPKSYAIDDWSNVIGVSLGRELGSALDIKIRSGITLIQDLAVGGELGFLYDQGSERVFSSTYVSAFGRLYQMDGPLRLVTSGAIGYQGLDIKGTFLHERSSRLMYDAGIGFAYPISRMGDPFNLELTMNYRSPFRPAFSFEQVLYVSVSAMVYM